MTAREIGKRIVVKVGSALVTNNGQQLDLQAISSWCRQIAELQDSGYQVIFVSSGAIACGMRALGWQKRPRLMNELQAAAAVGQMDLCQIYREQFAAHNKICAQILLTHQDLSDRQRYLNARATLLNLLALGVVPIINENDTVVTDEIKFGDNDTLAALVANLVEADLLLILTDQRGLYTADPRKSNDAQFLSEVTAGDPWLETIAGSTSSHIAKGGMITKVLAAKRAARSGAHTIVASGREDEVMVRIIKHVENIGSYFHCSQPAINARKQWLADHLQLAGSFHLDQGAKNALNSGKSLLAIGVVKVIGEFTRGSAVACISEEGVEIARGLTNYSSSEARQILGIASQDIDKILGYQNEDELIHRDNLLINHPDTASSSTANEQLT